MASQIKTIAAVLIYTLILSLSCRLLAANIEMPKQITVNGNTQTIGPNGQLELAWPVKSLQIQFNSVVASTDDLTHYHYRLKGLTEHWTKLDNNHRLLSLVNVPAGEYRLQIKLIQDKNLAAVAQSEWVINIAQPLWQTLPFQLFAMVLLLAILAYTMRWRTRKLKKRLYSVSAIVGRKTAELLTLTEVIRELNTTLDVQSITDKLQNHLAKALDAEVFALAIVDHQNNQLSFRNVIEHDQPLAPFDIDLDNDEHVAVACVQQKQVILMDRSEDSVKYLGKPSKPMAGKNMQSVIYHPLIDHEGMVLGCITVQSPLPYAYSSADKELVAILASTTAIALDNARAYQTLEVVSRTDFLTQLPNRRAFFETAQNMVARSKRNLSSFAIVMTDIDHFKAFNDNYGHDAGDHILKHIAKLMKQTIREQDHVCRWGGEEFIFLLPETPITGAVKLMEKLREAVENSSFEYGSHQLNVTMTFGVTIHSPGEALLDCINRSDALLYQGKQSGRNKVVCDG